MNTKVLFAGLLALGTVASVQAAPITGEIKFGSWDPVALTGGSGTFLTATGFDFTPIGSSVSAPNAVVNFGATGAFSGLALSFADFKDFTFAPLPVGGADVWEISGGGSFSFHLDSVTVTRGVNSIFLSGVGVVSGPGWDPAEGSFQFSVQGDSAVKTSFSFSANNKFVPVPDAGGSLAMLGLALLGFGLASRRGA